MVTLNGWHSLEQGWNGIAHIQADLLEPIFGPGMAVPGGHRGWKRPQIGHKCSVLAIGSRGPGPRIPPRACQPIFMFARSLQKRVLREKFQIRWFDGLPFRISTNYMMGSFTIIGYLWERINKGGKWVILILEPARLLGACKPGSRARMDSRTGAVATLNG